ncbi:energy transducer TonB [Erythrobacter sp. MTPC3]|uniref:energy transducer TonB n=1 Tax=Erythrobacter sp. MTPC3 TaxID=3056564 RepID=UPI0036F3C1E6
MKYLFTGALVAAATVAAAPASAATLELEPSSEWKLRAYDDKCRMIGSFGEGDNAVMLWLEKGSPGPFLNVSLIGRPFRSPFGSWIELAFLPGKPINRGYIGTTSSKGRPVITMFGVAPISFDPDDGSQTSMADDKEVIDLSTEVEKNFASPDILAERYEAVQAFELSGPLVQKVSLKTGGLGAVMQQLDRCIEAMAQKRSIAMGTDATTLNVASWAMQIQRDYPSYLLRDKAIGSVGVRVEISPEGRATFCEVTKYEGSAGFTDPACLGMLRYSRFNPATDMDGNPVAGNYSTRISYRVN